MDGITCRKLFNAAEGFPKRFKPEPPVAGSPVMPTPFDPATPECSPVDTEAVGIRALGNARNPPPKALSSGIGDRQRNAGEGSEDSRDRPAANDSIREIPRAEAVPFPRAGDHKQSWR